MSVDRALADKYPIIVGLGESVFDCFPDRRVVGGAPLNFAFHADQLVRSIGGIGIVASRLGQDQPGEELCRTLSRMGLSLSGLQFDRDFPTGEVIVNIDQANHPTYEIREGVAWDHFAYNEAWDDLARRCDAVSFGTLAQRSVASREAIYRFLDHADKAIRLCDVNLRQSFFDADILRRSFQAANVVKLNESELATVCQLLRIAACTDDREAELAYAVCRSYGLDYVVVTRGAKGTVMYDTDRRHVSQPAAIQPNPDADSVGAGDSCGAAIAVGMLANWTPEATLAFANAVGAFVASHPGATPTLPSELIEIVTRR